MRAALRFLLLLCAVGPKEAWAAADEAMDVLALLLDTDGRREAEIWLHEDRSLEISNSSLLEASACDDRNWQCYGWARLGYCSTNAAYMKRNCRKSCDNCGGVRPARQGCRGINQPCWINAQCCSARCAVNTYHCRPVR
mmetsp:Transcript_46391/g.86673  ORF Transcript_46391/g.86673 Transcript_46391/m.86673 type:complete len:139 (+) Transcript_46391:71-487(+)